MLKIKYSAKFKKDIKKIKDGNRYNLDELMYIVNELANQRPLDKKHHDHALTGKYNGYRECHIRPDWLLIYSARDEILTLTLSRTGSHAELLT